MSVPFQKLHKYPHMMPNDVKIWERFIELEPDRFDTVIYDLHVGEGRPITGEGPEWQEKQTKTLTQFRIDVVGFMNAVPTLVEVKPFAQLSAFGQILAYRYFWQEERRSVVPPLMMIITDNTTPDMKSIYRFYGVEVYETGTP